MNEISMVEHVARAIFFRGGEPDDAQWKHCQPYLREIAMEQARCAIEAMRTLTDRMELAGLRETTIDPTWFKPAWQAAIDAALSSAPIGEK